MTNKFEQAYNDYVGSLDQYENLLQSAKELAQTKPEDLPASIVSQISEPLGAHLISSYAPNAIGNAKSFISDKIRGLVSEAQERLSDATREATTTMSQKISDVSEVAQDGMKGLIPDNPTINPSGLLPDLPNLGSRIPSLPDPVPELGTFPPLKPLSQSLSAPTLDSPFKTGTSFDNLTSAQQADYTDILNGRPNIGANLSDDLFNQAMAERAGLVKAGFVPNQQLPEGQIYSRGASKAIMEDIGDRSTVKNMGERPTGDLAEEFQKIPEINLGEGSASVEDTAAQTAAETKAATTVADEAVPDVAEGVASSVGADVAGEAAAEGAGEAIAAATGAETGGIGLLVGGLVTLGGVLANVFGHHHSAPPPPAPTLSQPVYTTGLAQT